MQNGYLPRTNGDQTDHGSLAVEGPNQTELSRVVRPKKPIVIASTFTADAVLNPLAFWMRTLEIEADITIAPYAQVLQELLNPASAFCRNTSGINVLMVRLEDWVRDRLDVPTSMNVEHIHNVSQELEAAVTASRLSTHAPLLLLFCPSSGLLEEYEEHFRSAQAGLTTRLASIRGIHCCTHAEIVRLYPVSKYLDSQADRIGHIPYTSEYFAGIATFLARRIAVLCKPPYKVIALDCDDTLWKGICGEAGPHGIELTDAHLQFQRVLVQQYEAGVLLCLCSKNNLSDVQAVFRAHPEMPLREDHLISCRVNWDAKSSSLVDLSEELGLSLESFIFVDDSALECEEVKTHCPAVLTLHFPHRAEDIAQFLDHTWAFDRLEVTEEARERTAQYRQNRARDVARARAGGLGEFLASLQLQVDVSVLEDSQLPRAAELIQRTNQFNLTSIRRSSGELAASVSAGEFEILVAHVRDRFGDYGLVGVVVFRRAAILEIDTFALSCRALGRGAEHRIVNELGRIARQCGLPEIEFRYRPTSRNAPAQQFLDAAFGRFKASTGQLAEHGPVCVYKVPAEYAEALQTAVVEDRDVVAPARRAEPEGRATPSTSARWHEAATRLTHVSDILLEVNRSTSRASRSQTVHTMPGTETEAGVAAIWAEILGLEHVGLHDDFFKLGGDSLLAVQALARIESRLGLELSLHELFDGPTVEQVARKLSSASPFERTIERVDRSATLPLSWAQQRLWFIDQLDGASAAYHLQLAVRLHGVLNCDALQCALDTVIERHEALRTVFIKVGGEPVQKILPSVGFSLRRVNLEGSNDEVVEQVSDEFAAPFDLSTGPLIRGLLLELSGDEHVLLITMHHMVSDGWSIGVLTRELRALYQAHDEGRPDPLPPLPIQYVDYSNWQRNWLTGVELKSQLRYWVEHLRGAPRLLELPTDRPRPALQSYRGSSVRIALGTQLTSELKVLAQGMGITLAMVLHAAFAIVLARLSGQSDVVIGVPVANRRRIELETLIGFFVNSLAVRVCLDDDPPVSELLQRVRNIMLDAQAHQDVPFEKVVEAIQPARSMSHSPLFQVMFVLQNAPCEALELPGLLHVEQEIPVSTSQFDLALFLQDSAAGIVGSLNYNSDLFERSTAERWSGYIRRVLNAMIRTRQARISELPLMSESEHRQVVELFSSPLRDVLEPKLIQHLFEGQVERTPNALAVCCADRQLTYDQLNRRANQLAHILIAHGVGADDRVAVHVERGVDLVVGMLAVLKAGGAYVPLDISYPFERLAYMLADARPALVLTEERLKGSLPPTNTEIVALDSEWERIVRASQTNPDAAQRGVTPSHLAYVIYTSGSTGNPKGVMIEHRSVSNLIAWHRTAFDLQPGNRCSCVAAVGFDATGWEIWPALSVGATLALAPAEAARDVEALIAWWLRERLDVSFLPTPLAEIVLSRNLRHPTLRRLLVGGDRLRHHPRTSSFQLINNYGPTESTVVATSGCVSPDDCTLHIGRPITNTQIYILDSQRQPVPIGVSGEIYIGGAGLARGYLNQPELTARRFVANRIGTDGIGRLYKTGDLARWRHDGTIEYLGRNDHQVKMRGFRIELGEIEAQLMRHSAVKEAVVTLREDAPAEQQLVAYVVSAERGATETPPSPETLRTHLKRVLPDYMVPSFFVLIERLPLTPNGKLDRHALPKPERGMSASREYVAPCDEVEELLAEIWEELLKVRRISTRDDFFELGGHSLLATRVTARVRDAFDIELAIRDLFNAPTIEQLAARIRVDGGARAGEAALRTANRTRDLRREVDEMSDDAVLARIAELERELDMPERQPGTEHRVS